MKKNILTLSLLRSLLMAGIALLPLAAQAEPETSAISTEHAQEARTENLEKTQANQESQKKSLTVFAHGLGGQKEEINGKIYDQMTHYERYHHIIPTATGQSSGRSFDTYKSDEQCSLGQDHEIGNLHAAITDLLEQNPDTDIVLQGVSLGAATITNYLGTQQVSPRIKGAILESPFGKPTDCSLSLIPAFAKRAFISTAYKNHNHDGIQPVKVAQAIDKETPILLIASKKDWLIPAHSTASIYYELIKAGHKRVHLYIVDHGGHANFCFCQKNKTWAHVLGVVHAFRKKYNLGNYNEKIAKMGQKFFDQTQPPLPTPDFASLRSLSSGIKNATTQVIKQAAQPRTANTRWQKSAQIL
jgi:predicted alpha/beta-fold hydrolase